ncbi:hypothetical protein [Parageobacillus thermoglucosidasius]|uniref:hypothetical protein n=1 Tax=Parageobacillus thermoglucosidasius TaxID=1426 RepID=UPI0002E1A1AA|nr:hypothetical protein [Parageobacillus thermoglucosidasius]MBY6270078.1 hypothetical protein [Parageobacillus thermoglucosidasius]
MEYIKEIRHVYINILKQPKEWETYYKRAIVPHQSRLPAFLDEWNSGERGHLFSFFHIACHKKTGFLIAIAETQERKASFFFLPVFRIFSQKIHIDER